MKTLAAVTAALVLSSFSLFAAEPVDLATLSRIREEGFKHSQVMDIASGLVDGIGARLTGSPHAKRANEWTRAQLESMGLKNAHLESWGDFGRGWSYELATARMTTPDTASLVVIPMAWSPSTAGVVHGKPLHLKFDSDADYEKMKGKLAGAIVLLGDEPEMKAPDTPLSIRIDEKTVAEIASYSAPDKPRFTREEFQRRRALRKKRLEYFAAENVAAVIEAGKGPSGGTFGVQSSGNYKIGEPAGVPWLVMEAEQFGRITRLLDRNMPVELELESRTRFYDDDHKAYNTIAEIPGTDKSGEVVMIGAHLDSWHAGTGATDNGAGVAATMEAVRILQSLGVAPRRTIRIALWTGEEQGLLGSMGYVSQHFASRAEPTDPAEKELPSYLRKQRGALTTKPEYAKLAAYFNLDNGGGKIRGIYAQGNAAAVPIFQNWLEPLHDLGATIVTMRDTGSTDHISFDAVGLPGFQFVQDTLDYESRTHHTNADVYERLQPEDLMQASVILASFVWNAANRQELMPRKAVAR